MKKIFSWILLGILTVACGETPEETRNIQLDDNGQDVDLGFEASDYVVKTFYNVPSPSEQMDIIKSLDGELKIDAVNDLGKAETYLTSSKRCLNFGVYCSDASYLAANDQKSTAFQYIGTLERLGNEIGINAVLGDELSKIVDGDMTTETIFKLADEMYLRSFDRLIENEKGEDLGLILMGAWVESMYLVLESHISFEKSPKINSYLADQKIVAENLLSFLLDYQDNEVIVSYTEQLGKVLSIYDGMNCTYPETKIKHEVRKSSNVIRVSGGTICKMNETVLTNLTLAIAEIRNEIIE